MFGLVAVLSILLLLVVVPPLVNMWSGALRSQRTGQVQAFQDARSAVENDIKTIQAAERGYLLTQQPAFIDSYHAAETRLTADLQALRQLAPQIGPALSAEVTGVEAETAQWHAQVGQHLQLVQQHNLAAAVADVAAGRGQQLYSAVVGRLDRLDRAGREARAQIVTSNTRLQRAAGGLAIALGLLAILPGAYMIGLFRRSSRLAAEAAAQGVRAAQATCSAHDQLAETRQRNQQLIMLNQLAAASAAPLAVRTRAEGLLGVLAPALKADHAAIWLLQIARGSLNLVATAGLSPTVDQPGGIALDAVPLVARVLSEGRPIVVPEHGLATTSLPAPFAPAARTPIGSYLLLPLYGREGAIGVLVLAAVAPGIFQPDEVDYYTTIANQAGLALDNARLYEALGADRQRLQAVFDQSPEGLIFAEAETGAIALANHAARALLGEDELAGRQLRDPGLVARFVRPDGAPIAAHDLPLLRAIADTTEVRAEVLIEQDAGTRVPALVTAVPLQDEAGVVRGVVAVLQDLSRFREVERLKSDFVAMVSHELRTPLTAIQGCTQTLLRSNSGGTGRTHEFLTIIDAQSNRLQELIDNLLSLSQVEAGALRLRRGPLDIERLIRSLVRQVAMQLPDLRIQASIPTPLPVVAADPRRIEQVLLNVLDNARKVSPPGGTITVLAHVAGAEIQIGVQDQGPGIPAAERTRVFERFYQGTSRPAPGGTGLGLAICRALVEAHGGRIGVADGTGPGALVQFTLPLQPPESYAAAPQATLETVAQHAHDGAHILLVDDEPTLRRVVEASLADAGYTVGSVAEGVAAVEYAATERPDLIVLDLLLPGEDGFRVLQHLRDFTQAPIMMLTASADERHVVRGLQLGADDYLLKPFKMDELLARVAALLRRARPGRDTNAPVLINAGDLTIDTARRSVYRGQQLLDLTPTEYRLLIYLARHAGQVLTHEQLLHHVWGAEYGGESQYLWVHVSRLRQKIEADPRAPGHILTERGAGYRFEL